MNSLRLQQDNGFSLVEALVAIAILLTVISGIMLLVNQSIRTGQDVSNRLAASYLASDAIEYLRYERDSTWLSDNNDSYQDWINSLKNRTGIAPYGVDTRKGVSPGNSIDSCSDINGCKLYYDTVKNVYGYESGGSWEESKYTRKITFLGINDLSDDDDNDGGKDELIVEVTVIWPQSGGGTGELVLTDTLSSWGD
jgi:type II secretory pathway pseudopilin PulG